jgi:hypothetical protein
VKALLFAMWMLVGVAGAQTPKPPTIVSPSPEPFVVFDALLYTGKPDLKRFGMASMAGSGDLWRPGVSRDIVDERGIIARVRYMAARAPSYYLDIEHWPVIGVPEDTIRSNIAKLIRVADTARATSPNSRFGFYGLLPQGAYWEIVLKDTKALAAWHRSHELSRPLAGHVDFVLPSLYTFYEDRDGWAKTSREVLRAARQYGKPVYPFLWPEYHDGSKLAGQAIPRDYWRMQLELCRQYADGVVIWGGWQKQWDPKAPWWLETQEFLRRVRPGAANAAPPL